MALGGVVRARRQQLGVQSQHDLAYTARINRTYLSGIERGKRNPSLAVVIALSGALEIKASELVEAAEDHGWLG